MLNQSQIKYVLANRSIEPRLAAEIAEVMERFSGQPMRYRRLARKSLSSDTERLRLYNIACSLEELNLLGYKLRTINNLENRHIRALVQYWIDEGLSITTIDNKLSYFRWFVSACGRRGMLGKLEDYVPEGTPINRSRIAVEPKTFCGNNVDPVEVIRLAMEREPRIGYILLIMLTFGLRVAEASKLRIRKRLDEALHTAKLIVEEGAKNGRRRELPLDTWQQLDVLLDALPLVDGPHGSLIPYGRTWDKWRKHLYRQVNAIGLKREGENALGLTPHSFRHENLNDLFYRVTGKPSPVHGGKNFDSEIYRLAMEKVVERAGHFDRYKAGAYLSSPRAMSRKAAKSPNG